MELSRGGTSQGIGAEARLARLLAGFVERSCRVARAVAVAHLVLAVGLAAFAARNLGVNADNKRLLAPDLPFQRAAAAFARHFPSLDDALLVVVDAGSADAARDATRRLADRLQRLPEFVRSVAAPGADSFFEERGLLYRSPAELEDLVNHLSRMQPVIVELARDASIATLARLVRIGLEQGAPARESAGQGGASTGGDAAAGSEAWSVVLDRIGEATARVFDEHPVSISWEDLMLRGSAIDPGTRQILIVDPVLSFGDLLPAGAPLAAVRRAAVDLGLTPENGIRIRITGNPALNHEEMLGLAWDVGASSVLSFAIVALLLVWAFGSSRLVLAALLTLISGLIWTAAFAAAAVGQLNLVSIAFAVMFIGLGVDFAIHLGLHCAESIRQGQRLAAALQRTAHEIGVALALCALTTSIGFFAFVPTDFRGVAELGLIAGVGMFVILVETLTLFPALLSLLLGARTESQVGRSAGFALSLPIAVRRRPRAIVAAAVGLALLAATLVPRVRFDSNVVEMRDPRTESVQAFRDLLARSATSPWYVDVLTATQAEADRVRDRLRSLASVKETMMISDLIPAEQQQKIEILSDAALMLDAGSAGDERSQPLPVVDQIAALRELHDALQRLALRDERTALAKSVRALERELAGFLSRTSRPEEQERALAELERLLLGSFPAQLARLQRALAPQPIRPGDLPPDLRRRFQSEDGHLRVQVFPRENLIETAALRQFVDEVRSVAPDATGVAVNLLEFGRATATSLREALALAFAAIALLLWVLWRRLDDVLLTLAPLVLGAIWICAGMVLADLPFNFANVLVLPLLLGVGVDSGIHLVSSARRAGQLERKGGNAAPDILAAVDSDTLTAADRVGSSETTVRAIFFSTATTIVSFGSLAFSHHRGIASMGLLLTAGMLVMLVCNLVVLPALLDLRD